MAWKYDQERAARAYREIEARHKVERETAPLAAGFCYFVGCLTDRVVKIGYSNNVNQRVNTVKSNTGPYRVSLLATARGGRATESHYHDLFAKHAIGGEWYTLAPEIEAEIERLRSLPDQWHETAPFSANDLAGAVKTKLTPARLPAREGLTTMTVGGSHG